MSEPKLDVYVAPMRPMVGEPGQGPGDDPMWSPMSSTLIYGANDGVLVDTLVTYDQVDALAEWVKARGVRLTEIYLTHGHSDHWIGLERLLEHFPDARGVATEPVFKRAQFEATSPALSAYWHQIFPGEIPDAPVLPEVLTGEVLELEGHQLKVIPIGQGDTSDSTILHVPDINAVVAGDVVYNQVHMMMGEVDAAGRQAWIESLNQVEALHPTIVVSGHKRVGAPDLPETIEQSRQYLRDFSRVADENDTVEAMVTAMLELHPDRDNTRVVWHSARAEVARRA